MNVDRLLRRLCCLLPTFESLQYGAAHQMSLLLLAFAFTVLLGMYLVNRRWSPQ